jgi:hypothetical protein
MDITDPHTIQTAFLNTYSNPDDLHPLRKIEQYERVRAFREHNPDAGRNTIGDTLDIPRGRVHGWVYNSTKPTGYEAYQTATDRGWLDLDWERDPFTGLNELVAWVFAGGNVSDSYTPVFNVDTETESVCAAALEKASIDDYTVTESNPDGEKSAPIIRVHTPQAVLGRLLVALGAPQGAKATQQYGLPCYLGVAPEEVREQFAAIYLLNRGVRNADRERIVVREERSVAYLEALAGFFRSLTSADVRRDGEYRFSIAEQVLSDVSVPKKWNDGVS